MLTFAEPRSTARVADETTLDRLLAEARLFSGEFPDFLANHLPMILVALHRMGASDARLGAFFEAYRDVNRLPPPPPRVAPITRANWDEALGDRSRERDYREYFHAEVATLGARAAVATYLPRLLPGVAASATHGLMRLAYGVMRGDAQEIATALGYWSATYLELGVAGVCNSITDDPTEILIRMRPVESYRKVEVERDLLWHFMRAMSAKPEFRPVVDWLAIGPGTAQRMREASLGLFAGTMDFCALHALTGCHWLRLLDLPEPEASLALRYFWQAIASLYPKIGFPDMPCTEALAGWRAAPCPDWAEIEAAAVRSDDEHDISLAFTAREEGRLYGDRLYQVVAARRLGLIA